MWPASAQRMAFFSIQPMTSITALRFSGVISLPAWSGWRRRGCRPRSPAGRAASGSPTAPQSKPSEPLACRSLKVGTSQTPFRWKAALPAEKSATEAGYSACSGVKPFAAPVGHDLDRLRRLLGVVARQHLVAVDQRAALLLEQRVEDPPGAAVVAGREGERRLDALVLQRLQRRVEIVEVVDAGQLAVGVEVGRALEQRPCCSRARPRGRRRARRRAVPSRSPPRSTRGKKSSLLQAGRWRDPRR